MKKLILALVAFLMFSTAAAGCSLSDKTSVSQVSLSPDGLACKAVIEAYWAAFNNFDISQCLSYLDPVYAETRKTSLQSELDQFEMGKALGVKMVVDSVTEPVTMTDGRLDMRVSVKVTPVGLSGDRYLMYYMVKDGDAWKIARQTTDTDKTPPGGPENLDPVAVSASQVDIKWDDKSSREDGYRVERALDKTFKDGLVSFVLPASTSTFSDTTVVPGAAYYYRVYAFGKAGDSDSSARIFVTVPAS